jgi:aspartyl protease
MRRVWLRAIAISTATFVLLSSAGTSQSIKTVTASSRRNSGSFLIVPIVVNRMGPYDFVLDTGSTSTLIDASLFETLGLYHEGTTNLTSVANHKAQVTATASEVSLNGISVTNVKVVSLDNFDSTVRVGLRNSGVSEREAAQVRGLLGENFLDHFDLLIDNVDHSVTLDATGGVTQMYDGEQLPLSPTSNFEGTVVYHRPMVSATVMSFSRRPLHLLLDTASSSVLILPARGTLGSIAQGGNAAPVEILTPDGKVACAAWKDQLRWGRTSVNEVVVVSCNTARAEALDNEGSMPTHIFKQILISHANKYVVVNPVRRSPQPRDH